MTSVTIRRTYKKLIVAIATVWMVAFVGVTGMASAHLPGQAPYFKVNDKFINLYPIINPDVRRIDLPQTTALDHVLPGSPVRFELVPALMPVSEAARSRSVFTMDFGDSRSAKGIAQEHAYEKSGSYIVKVYADDGGGPQLIESVVVHVVPYAGYRLPEARIRLNGTPANDRAVLYQADFRKRVELDASDSRSASSRIIRHQWDFADGNTSGGANVGHIYDAERIVASPVLRVWDENGLFADAIVDISNSSASSADAARQDSGLSLARVYESMNRSLKLMLGKAFGGSDTNFGIAAAALGFAAVAGGLHSLTPGHGKSIMAALLIGRRRSKMEDVVIVASAITLTHTAVIFAVGFAFLVLDATVSIDSIVGYFEKASAVLILLLAGMLLWSGIRKWRHRRVLLAAGADQGHSHTHEHGHSHNHTHTHPTAKDFGAVDSRWGLFVAGASGGMVPCIDALALLLLAVSLGYVAFGLLIVFAFSLGLAGSIIVIGLLLLAGHKRLKPDGRLAVFAEVYSPMIAGLLIMAIAVSLLLR